MSRILLPKYTFLNGPPGSGKTTLAKLLLAQDSDLCKLSFADPIRLALTATFYPDYLYTPSSLDLEDDKTKDSLIPGTSCSHRRWMIDFGRMMHGACSRSIFGEIIWRQSYESNVMYPRFVLDGLRTQGDLTAFLREEKLSDLLIISLYRKGKDWGDDLGSHIAVHGAPFINLHNDGTPERMTLELRRILGVTDDNPVPA